MRVAVVAAIVLAVGCARRPRVVLEPESTSTQTWVGSSAPASAPAVVAAPPPPAAAPPPAETSPPAEPVERPAATPPRPSRPWTRAGAWGR